MPEINIDFVAILDRVSQVLEVAALCFGAFMAAFWISLVVWTFRDIRSRTHDIFFQLLSVLLVLVFNVLGLFLYLILRPKETLAERYERALAEEALLQDIEERPVCPSCGVRVASDFMLCPACHTQLKHHCDACGRLNELKWKVCPYCGHVHEPAEAADTLEARAVPVETEQVFGRPAEDGEPGAAVETTVMAESDHQMAG
ncbi:MAG: zinc ribbon domain-containing protein [Chloroflexi bacterium]|nr:MAG: zinc ribbon domain-containing protein [Chloroflexota bacterium]